MLQTVGKGMNTFENCYMQTEEEILTMQIKPDSQIENLFKVKMKKNKK